MCKLYPGKSQAPHDQRRVTPQTRWKGVIDGGPSLYGNGLVGLWMDGSTSVRAASGPGTHPGLHTDPFIGGGAQGLDAREQAGAQDSQEGCEEEGRQEEGCQEEGREESGAEEAFKEESRKKAGKKEGRQEGRAPADQEVRQEGSQEGPSPEIALR